MVSSLPAFAGQNNLFDYVEFKTAKDFADAQLPAPKNSVYVDWTEVERKEIEEIFQDIFVEYPGLLVCCGSGKKLAIYRVNSNNFIASSKSRRLTFANLFFLSHSPSRRKHAVLHELIHVADIGCQIAYSPQFLEISRPLLFGYVGKAELVSADSRKQLESLYKQKTDWCGFYAASNFREAFAEYACFKLESGAREPLISKLTEPSQAELDINQLISDVIDLNEKDKSWQLIQSCKKALSMCPSNPNLKYLLAANYSRNGQLLNASQVGRSAVTEFLRLRLTPQEEWFHFLLKDQAQVQYKLGKFQSALIYLDRDLLYYPNDINNLRLKSQCLEAMGLQGESLWFKYRSLGYMSVNESLNRISLNPQLTDSLLNTNAPWNSAGRFDNLAELSKLAALNCSSLSKKVELLNLAIQYREQQLRLCNERSAICIDLSSMYLMLGDMQTSEKFVKQALINEPTSISASLIRLQVLERTNQNLEAKKLADELRKIISALPPKKDANDIQIQKLDLLEMINLETSLPDDKVRKNVHRVSLCTINATVFCKIIVTVHDICTASIRMVVPE